MDSYTNNELPSTRMKLSLFLELFSKMDRIIKKKLPESHTQFFQYRGAIQRKMQQLELIKNRYIDSASLTGKCFEIFSKKWKLYSTSANLNVLKEASEFSEFFNFARRSTILDIESFLVFSRVVLDYIPWILQPYLKGNITKQEPKTVNFREFCKWFQDNPDKVIDEEFNEFLKNFYDWFTKNLREPRNDLVIHLQRRYTLDSFSSDGKVVRLRYFTIGDKDSEEKYDLTSPEILFEKIFEFLMDLEGYLIKILAS